MKYGKPHLSFDKQVAQLQSRGLAIPDPEAAVRLLARVGYYGWSAYVYPFRTMLPADQQYGAHFRSDELRPGVNWAQVEALWVFDRKLRQLALDAAETIEVGVRTRLAYVLGARDPFSHVIRESLDAVACARPGVDGLDTFDAWVEKYRQQLHEARGEDFVRHHYLTYPQSEIPIWVAIEFLSFGSVTRLLSLARPDDQNAVARPLGVSSGKRLHGFLMTVSHVRNIAAHHGRLWNRHLGVSLSKFHPTEVGADLDHLAGRVIEPKMYGVLAVMAYLVRTIDPASNWPRTLMTHLMKFPQVPYLTAEVDMGVPDGWDSLPLWRDEPKAVGFTFPLHEQDPA